MKIILEKDKLLVLLLITDLIFILLHILNVYTGLLNSSYYLLYRDRGYAEFFQYTKELWIVVLFLFLAIKKKRGIFYVFSLLFTYLLVDDYFEVHERLGRLIAETLNFQGLMGLRAVDLGELLVSGLFGLLFLIALVLFFFLSDINTRRIALYMGIFFVLLAFFGVALDMVGVVVDQRAIVRLLVILEEGGEMLVMSLITWFVYRLNYQDDQLPLNWLPIKVSKKLAKG
jgi:hypothetical protein